MATDSKPHILNTLASTKNTYMPSLTLPFTYGSVSCLENVQTIFTSKQRFEIVLSQSM